MILKLLKKHKEVDDKSVSDPIIRSNVDEFIAGGGVIGEGCDIFPDVFFGSEPYLITIGNNVRITFGVKFITHDGGVWTLRKMGLLEDADVFGKIEIGDNTNIGWNVLILPGVKIGRNCVIGAGSIVTKDIPDGSVAVGIPVRVIESIEEYYEKVKKKCDMTKHMDWQTKKDYLLNNKYPELKKRL